MIRFAEVEVSNERGEGAAGAAGAAMSDRVLADRKPRLSVGTPIRQEMPPTSPDNSNSTTANQGRVEGAGRNTPVLRH